MNRSRLLGLIRLIVSLAVASWAINWVLAQSGANLQHEFRNCNWGWLLVALLLTGLGTTLSSYRWASLLALQKVVISQWAAFRLTMIGVFFNLFGLGGVGGDVFKAVYVRQHAGSRTPEAVPRGRGGGVDNTTFGVAIRAGRTIPSRTRRSSRPASVPGGAPTGSRRATGRPRSTINTGEPPFTPSISALRLFLASVILAFFIELQ